MKTELQERTANLLKSELIRANVDYHELAKRLKKFGLAETYDSLNSKINRGTFKMEFFLMCMDVIDVDEIRL